MMRRVCLDVEDIGRIFGVDVVVDVNDNGHMPICDELDVDDIGQMPPCEGVGDICSVNDIRWMPVHDGGIGGGDDAFRVYDVLLVQPASMKSLVPTVGPLALKAVLWLLGHIGDAGRILESSLVRLGPSGKSCIRHKGGGCQSKVGQQCISQEVLV